MSVGRAMENQPHHVCSEVAGVAGKVLDALRDGFVEGYVAAALWNGKARTRADVVALAKEIYPDQGPHLVSCSDCGGEGWVTHPHLMRCEWCNGSGRVNAPAGSPA